MKRVSSFALALIAVLNLAACGSQGTAAAMRLTRSVGTVAVSDGGGKDVPLLDNLGLYSGYGVDTRSESYAWISLDDTKLAKMDQESEISIQKEGKALDIELKSGGLFFNVTEPLADDETMNISTSTMLVGIRGTCGWVVCEDSLPQVYLLEGKVECSAGDQTVQVNAGEMAELRLDGELVVEPFSIEDIPAFVQDEAGMDVDSISKLAGRKFWNGHTYQVFDLHDPSWLTAEEYCESLGGHLASISSQEENSILYRFMIESGYTSAYFGLLDRDSEGIWTWVTGEPVTYTNWHTGEPNSVYEAYGMFYNAFTDGTWNDGDFGAGHTSGRATAFICEWDYINIGS